ncbi:MAG: DUF2283 domain-containing protein [Bdellovibrionota bacterium]
MKIKYYPESDSLYIDLSSRKSSESQEVADGVVVDYDETGNIVGLGIDEASKILDLSELELSKLPLDIHKISA